VISLYLLLQRSQLPYPVEAQDVQLEEHKTQGVIVMLFSVFYPLDNLLTL